MTGHVQVTGARQLRRDLKAAGDDLSDLKDVYAAVASLVAARAQATAPRGKGRDSGRLAGTVRGNRAAGRAVITAGRASVPYAAVIHWGWKRRGITAQPWVSAAAQATETDWVRLYVDGVQAVLDRVAADG